MKKFTALFVALLLATLCLCPALAMEEGDYAWREHPVKVTGIDENPWLAPADIGENEHAIGVQITVEESVFNDDALRDAIYEGATLTDAAGNAYKPGAMLSKADELLLTLLFSIPNGVEAGELTLVLGEADEAPASAAEGEAGPVDVTTASGDSLTLTPLENGAFLAQSDKAQVHIRLGTTVHNGGSQFLAGSALSLATMKSTKQYGKPMAAFTYQTSLAFDEAADALGVIGAKTVLTLEGEEYPAQVVWITKDMAAFIFSGPELPAGTPRFTLQGERLVIAP